MLKGHLGGGRQPSCHPPQGADVCVSDCVCVWWGEFKAFQNLPQTGSLTLKGEGGGWEKGRNSMWLNPVTSHDFGAKIYSRRSEVPFPSVVPVDLRAMPIPSLPIR